MKTEASGGSWRFEKLQAVLDDDSFIFALKAAKGAQVCLLYNPGVVTGSDGGWCVTIGEAGTRQHAAEVAVLSSYSDAFVTSCFPEGGDGNTNTKVREGLTVNVIRKVVETPGLINDTFYTEFWLTW